MTGVDFGNMNCYLAVARNKGIEILMNDYSLHATPSCVSFGQSNRLMGVGARQQLNIHYRNTVLNFKHLLGRNFSDSIAQSFRPNIPAEVVELPNDSIGFKVSHLGEQRVFSPEQILASLFTHIRQLLAKSVGAEVTQSVLSVPYFFEEPQRIALLTAGRIAGIDFHLINDHAALAYNYGMYKGTELPAADKPPKLVAFIDCGHSGTQASLVAFNAGKAQVLSASHSLEVGGLHLDALLRDHFAAAFLDKYGIDARKNVRAWLRLLDECERLKKQMSANSQAIPLSIDCLMEEVDVSGSMQRAQFEELAEPQLQKLRQMLQELVHKAQVSVEQIADVELIGGSTRIPCIKQAIAEFFKQEPRTTMNQDDAVARGCALRCASFFAVYQMKQFQLDDQFHRPIDAVKPAADEAQLIEWLSAEQEMEGADQRENERSDANNALEEYCFRVRHAMENESLCQDKQLADDVRLACMSECQKVLDWLDSESSELQKKQIECRHTELNDFCAPMMAQLYAQVEEPAAEGEVPMEPPPKQQNADGPASADPTTVDGQQQKPTPPKNGNSSG